MKLNKNNIPYRASFSQAKGVTLIELILFLVVIALALNAMVLVFRQNITHSVDPIERARATEFGQTLLDEILSRRFDENSPVGGVPHCDSAAGDPCLGIVPDSDFDDVGDYHNFTDNTDPNFTANVTVVAAGGDLGITNSQARKILVEVTTPSGLNITLGAYRVNF